jgi:hypothetical protein
MTALLALLVLVLVPAASGVSPQGSSAKADGWIKLCGLSTGCTIDPLPHPWLGKNVYNTTGRHQLVAVDIDEGEGARFWITIENDGADSASFNVRGCPGTRYFEVNAVVMGKQKRPNAGAENVTNQYKQGTLSFELDPGKKVTFTLNIVTHFEKNITYDCETVFTSSGDQSQDTVVAELTTY